MTTKHKLLITLPQINIFKVYSLLALLLLFSFNNKVIAQCTPSGRLLDNFQSNAAILGPLTANTTYYHHSASGISGILGGQRDISLLSTGNVPFPILDVSGGYFSVNGNGASNFNTDGIIITYDGNATSLDAVTGLGGINTLGTGAFSFTIEYGESLSAGQNMDYIVRVYSSPDNYSEAVYYTAGPAAEIHNLPVNMPVTAFSMGAGAAAAANFAAVTAIQIQVKGMRSIYDFSLSNGLYIPCPRLQLYPALYI